jgi:hypothetical protein
VGSASTAESPICHSVASIRIGSYGSWLESSASTSDGVPVAFGRLRRGKPNTSLAATREMGSDVW